MNESYSSKNTLKNAYSSVDSINDLVKELKEIEADVFGPLDRMALAPSQEVMNKIYSCL